MTNTFDSALNIICLESEAFFSLVETVVHRLKGEEAIQPKWIPDTEAMVLLNIKSKTTLQKLRDEGAIRFTQPKKRLILYDRESIMEYLETYAKNTF